MAGYFYQTYLRRQKNERIESRRIEIGREIVERLATVAGASVDGGGSVWVLSDGNTEEAAGARVRDVLSGAGLRVVGPVLPADPKPEPVIDLCDELADDARGAALVVAVGGGTISDIAKKVSADNDVPNWCVPTAPSVDAFTSAKSALRIRGYHRTPFVRPSEYVLCDLAVLERAPTRLLQAGVGDLLAKYFAYVDWTLSSWINGEDYDAVDAEHALESARRAISAVREARGVGGHVAERVVDAALTSGLIMQKRGNSRAAASAEHTIAHFWEVAHVVSSSELDLHGILAAAASGLVLKGYLWLVERLATVRIDTAALARRYDSLPAWQAMVDPAMDSYRDKMEEEMADRDFSPAAYRHRLAVIQERRSDMIDLTRPILEELEQAMEILVSSGFPIDLTTLGIDDTHVRLSLGHVRFLRNRYGLFDVAADLGLFDELQAAVIGELSTFH